MYPGHDDAASPVQDSPPIAGADNALPVALLVALAGAMGVSIVQGFVPSFDDSTTASVGLAAKAFAVFGSAALATLVGSSLSPARFERAALVAVYLSAAAVTLAAIVAAVLQTDQSLQAVLQVLVLTVLPTALLSVGAVAAVTVDRWSLEQRRTAIIRSILNAAAIRCLVGPASFIDLEFEGLEPEWIVSQLASGAQRTTALFVLAAAIVALAGMKATKAQTQAILFYSAVLAALNIAYLIPLFTEDGQQLLFAFSDAFAVLALCGLAAALALVAANKR